MKYEAKDVHGLLYPNGKHTSDSVADAIGALLGLNGMDPEKAAEIAEAVRHDLKEDREGEEWREEPADE